MQKGSLSCSETWTIRCTASAMGCGYSRRMSASVSRFTHQAYVTGLPEARRVRPARKSDDDSGLDSGPQRNWLRNPFPGRSRVVCGQRRPTIVVSSLTSPMNIDRMQIQRPQGVAGDP